MSAASHLLAAARKRNGECDSERFLLLTGRPGVGKTTLVRRVVEGLPGRKLAGFYTEEIRKRGQRQGFCLVGFNGAEQMIAHVSFAKPPQVGKYGVDVNAIDRAVEVCLSLDPDHR